MLAKRKSAMVVRWAARILSVPILLFWGFFIVAHLMGDEGGSSRALSTNDYIGLAMMVVWFVGLAIAWKWELTGGTMTLVGILISAVANCSVTGSPME